MAASPVAPITPNALRVQDALAQSAPLALLRQRLRDSVARFEALRGVLPAALALHARPGPLDADGWTILAANPAVAAKLRQLEPRIQAALADQGWPAGAIRIKVEGR